MAPTNVVNLTTWTEPTNTLVELCDQATAVFAGTTRRDDPRIVTLATALMGALNRLENLPPVGGALGRAVDVLTHVNANNVDDVLDAIRQLRRLSATRAADPSAPEPSPLPAAIDPLTPLSSLHSSSPDGGVVDPLRRRKKRQRVPAPAVIAAAATPGGAPASALKETRRRRLTAPMLPGLEP